MKIPALIGAVGAAWIVWAGQSLPQSFEKKFDDPDVGSLKVLAVCTINPDSVSCWDADGKPNLEQTRRTEAAVLDQNVAVKFQYFKKNRYVVMRQVMQRGPNTLAWGLSYGGAFEPMTSRSLPDYSPSGENPTWGLYHVVCENDAKTLEVPFIITKRQAQGQVVLEKGASITMAGQTLTFQSSEKQPRSSYAFPPNTAAWTLTFTNPNPTPGINFEIRMLNKDKQPIAYLDAKGNQVASATYMDWVSHGGGNIRQFAPASNWELTNENGLLTFSTNVNPEQVRFVELTASLVTQARLTGIPADPAP
jgi:hypothetical protein